MHHVVVMVVTEYCTCFKNKQGQGGGELLVSGVQFHLGDDGKVLPTDGNVGCTIIYLIQLNYVFKNG